MTQPPLKQWTEIQDIHVGSWKKGKIVKDLNDDIYLLVHMDKNYTKTAEKSLSNNLTTDIAQYNKEAIRFKRNMTYYNTISHPSIPTLHELTMDENNQDTAIMSYLNGAPITKELYKATFGTCLTHFLQLLTAIHEIHKKNLLRLYFSPQYILTDLIREQSTLIDSWHIHSKDDIQNKNIYFHKLYVAPEVIIDGYADERSDLYSLAMIMFETLTNSHASSSRYLRKNCSIDELRKTFQTNNTWQLHDVYEHKDFLQTISLECYEFFYTLLHRNPDERGFQKVPDVIDYITNTWSAYIDHDFNTHQKILTLNNSNDSYDN